MATDSNYITSAEDALVSQAEKDINRYTKEQITQIDAIQKAEMARLKSGGIKGQIDNFLDAVKGTTKSVDELQTNLEQKRMDKEWKSNLTMDSPEMQQYDQKLNLLNEAQGHLTAAGYAELRKDNPDVDKADEFTTGDTGRKHRNSVLRNGAATYNAYLERGSQGFAIETPWSNGKEIPLANAGSLKEYDFIAEKLRYGYWRNFNNHNKGALNKYLFPEMKRTEETRRMKWIADRAKTIGEGTEAGIKKEFSEDVAARGGIAAIDYINNNKGRWPGSASFQREKAVGEFVAMLEDGSLSLARAEQILNQEFFAWDGSKQTPYDDANPNKKPYWPEFEKLAAAVRKKRTDKANERIRSHNANKGIFELETIERGKEIIKNGGTIDDNFRAQISRDWEEQFPGLPKPRYVSQLMTSGEGDDDESIRGLWAKHNRVGVVTEEDLLRAGIDDPAKLAQAYQDFGIARKGILDTTRMKNNITSWVNDEAQRTDLTTTKSETWHTMNRRATADYISTYSSLRKDGYDHSKATKDAEDLVRKNIADGIYRQPPEPVERDDNDVHKNQLKALKAIQTDKSILDREVLPGFEKNAEAVYKALESGKPLPTDPYKSLLYRRGIEGVDARKAAAIQANLWARSKGLKEIPLPESRVDTVLRTKPAVVTKALNNGDVHKALSVLNKDDSVVEMLEALERSESINNGKHNAIETSEGWKNSENILDKPLENHSIEDALKLDQAGLGAYGFSNTELEEALPFSGLTKTSKLTAENQRALYAGLIYRNLYIANSYQTLGQFDSNPMFSDWNAMNISEGDALLLLKEFGPKGPYNQKQFLLKALTK